MSLSFTKIYAVSGNLPLHFLCVQKVLLFYFVVIIDLVLQRNLCGLVNTFFLHKCTLKAFISNICLVSGLFLRTVVNTNFSIEVLFIMNNVQLQFQQNHDHQCFYTVTIILDTSNTKLNACKSFDLRLKQYLRNSLNSSCSI